MTTSASKQLGFSELTVVAFETRQADAIRKLIENEGGRAISAPALQEIPLEKNPEAFAFAERLLAGEIDVIIFMTGIGARYLMQVLETRYASDAITKSWSRTTVVARGPKPVKVLKELGVPITMTIPEPNTWREIVSELDENERSLSIKGKTVAVQEYGIPNLELIDALTERGAHVIRVPVYRWALPDNLEPLIAAVRAIVDGRVDMALFTTAAQVDHVFRVAREYGLEAALVKAFRDIVIASIGPTCSEALSEKGIPADFEPTHPKMGVFVKEAAAAVRAMIQSKKEEIARIGHRLEPKKQNQDRLRDSIFMRACRREPVERTPVWLMRQAGRYMKEYRDIRSRVSFLELCKHPELVCEVTVTAQEKLGVDAAIIFADLLLIVEPLGLELTYDRHEGPVISGAIRSEADVQKLKDIDPSESLLYVYEGIRLTRRCLNPDIPLIGFSGAPFTLASYIVEGGGSRNFERTKALMYTNPKAWSALLEKIVQGLVKYLVGQVDAGAQAVQIFDSWVGTLGPKDYQDYVLPHTQKLIRQVKELRPLAPIIHFGTGNPELVTLMREAGGDVIGVDFRIELDEAWKRVGYDCGIMGNLDPLVLCADPVVIKERAVRILRQAGGRPGHIFNLGHGILPRTPVENVQALVEAVHEYKL